MSNPINDRLAVVYKEWLEATKCRGGIFCNEDGVNKYSNPYFFGVPDDWDTTKDGVRILFVGQEGASGHWNAVDMQSDKYIAFDDVEKLQEASIATVKKRVGKENASVEICGENHLIVGNSSGFWWFFSDIATNGQSEKAYPCAWTNIDLVCYNEKRSNGKYTLREVDRKALHSTTPPILKRLIDIAKPTHVVFASWRDVSVNHEFASKPSKIMNDFFVKNGKNSIMLSHVCGIPCLVSYYHPQYLKGRKERAQAVRDYIYKNIVDGRVIEAPFDID